MNGIAAHDSFYVVSEVGDAPVLRSIVGIIERQITTRCVARAVANDGAAFRVALSVKANLDAEAYQIESGAEREVRVAGGSVRGVLYGVGKFLRTSRYDQGGFSPGSWRGMSSPDCPFRAIYLATHLGNFFEAAPRDEVIRYAQDLGLWGYNTILIHYPTHQFTGFDDPASLAWFAKFKPVLEAAKACGLMVGLTQSSNQYFKLPPPDLAFTRMSGQSNYGEALCTSKPAGLEMIVQFYRGLLDEFRDVGLDAVALAPYDEGGCGCADCWPWGSRGFPRLARALAPHIRAKHPGCAIVLATWCFESENDSRPLGEWEGMAASLEHDQSWADYIMADGHDDYFPNYPLEHGVPGGLPLLNFPEISMFGMIPWGGYGANPAPAHFQKLWERVKHMMSGGFPYSEGIYEDINKAIAAGFYWDKGRPAEETVREYAAFEYSPDVCDRVLEMVRIFEGNHNRHFIKASAAQAYALAKEVDAALSETARRGWRWRIFFLRAWIDREMFEHPDEMSGALRDAFRELTRIYHAECTDERIKPLDGRMSGVGRLSARHSPFVKAWQLSELQPPAELASVGAVSLTDALGWHEFVVPWFMPENEFICVHDFFVARDGLVYLLNRFSVEQTSEWILHLGHDGGAKVFVDGREVLCEPTRVNPATRTRSQARVRMERGTHEVVIAFDTDQGNGWGIYFCWERPSDQPEERAFPQRME
jgi:hypothetical protein